MRKLLIVLLGLPMVLLGILVHKYKPYPYPQFVWLYRIALINFGGQRFAAAELSKQYSHYTDKIPMDRFIESGVLPLQVTGVRLSESHAVPRIGGAITAIDDTVVILDRLGNVYAHALAGETRKLPLPPLPNNVMDYLRAGLPLDADVLRAYNVKYIASAKLLVVSHETFDRSLTTRMAVSVIQIDGSLDPVGTWKTVFLGDAEPYGSNQDSGGALAVDDQGGILLTIGDYKLAKENHTAPDGTPKFGKIVHINAVTQEKKTLSIGHRNPQGLLITKNGKIFSTEHGPRGGDELNLIVEGGNYGWPNVTLGTDYEAYTWNERRVGRHDGYRAPLFAWLPSIAVSNLIEVRGFSERWDGDLLVASLKAQSLFRLRLDGTRVLYSEPIFIGQRIRSLAQLSNGTIALWTDASQLLLISIDKKKLDANKRYPASLNEALRQSCMYCHHFGPTSPADIAPTLSRLFERTIASDNYRYTAALRGREGSWTEKTLRAFLSSPGQFASGTSMPRPNITAEEVDEIVRVLKEVSDAGR